jgi:hypothetical protein
MSTIYNYICGVILFCPHTGNYHGSKPIYIAMAASYPGDGVVEELV